MRLKPDQLQAAINRQLLPVYFICGDEPLQSGEAADCVRAAAKQAGFSQREVLTVENEQFNWALLHEQAASLSIFADKKLIDLRLPSGKPGVAGGKALEAYCHAIPQDTVLLITAGKITAAAQKSRWFQAVDKAGAVIQVWPLQGRELLQWLKTRSLKRGLKLNDEALKWLAMRVEGNMLAAAQEIEKLYILHGSEAVSRQQLEQQVVDHARFDVFKLADALVAGQLNKATRILAGLKAEAVAAPVVLWAISREARNLLQLKQGWQQSASRSRLFRQLQIWESKHSLYQSAVQRLSQAQLETILLNCALADLQIKGQNRGDCWETFFEQAVLFCRPETALIPA